MNLDNTSLCEVPKALMYIVRYVPMDDGDSSDKDRMGPDFNTDSGSASNMDSGSASSESLSIFLSF